MRVVLWKWIERTGEHALIEGEATYPPVVGRPFRVVDGDRRVTTTDVAAVLPDGWFVTLAGRYRVELCDAGALSVMSGGEG